MKRRALIALILGTGLAVQADTNTPTRPLLLYQVAKGEGSIEDWHDRWSESLASTVEYFDRFFGDERLKEDTKTTRLSLRVGVRTDRKDEVQLRQSIDARLALPRLENRLQIIFDNAIDVEDAPYLSHFDHAARDAKPDAGLRYILREDEAFRLTSDAGVRLGSSPQVFGRTRARYTVPFDAWELRLSERLQWFSKDGFGALSEMNWSRRVGDGAMLRIRSSLDWREDERGVEPAQSMAYYQVLNDRTSFNTLLRANWPETPHGGKANYGVETTLRRLVYSNWVFAEITPGLEYLEEDSFGWNPFLKVGFEIQFQRDPAAK